MIRYSASSKLFKYTTEEKKRYKLYKKKTMWVVAGISLFSTASFVQHVSADETQETTTLVQTDTDVTQKVEIDAQTDVATNEMVSQETDTVDVENKTSEVSLETSTAKTQDTSEVSQTQVFASETNTTADTPVQTNNQQNQIEEQVALEQETTLGKTNRENINGSLSTESAQAEVADTTGRTASVTAINQGDTTATLSAPKILADGSTEYTLTPSNLANGAGKLGLTISYTGQKGDTFSMVVSPKDFVGESRDIGDSMAPTGSPKKTRKDGNVTVFTWTMNDIADNVTATKTQTIPAVSFFWEDPLKSYEAYPPYMVGADTRATMLRGGEKIEIKFLVNGQEAPSSTTTSIVLEKAIKIADINVTNIVNSNNNKRTTDENYTYKVVPKYEKNIRMQGYFKLNIPVPEHFLLDEQATKDFLKNNANNGAYVNGEFKVTQPNGEGTPIIIESQALPYMFFGQSDQGIYFVGRYTSTQTTGASEKPSGWYDLGNGEKHYFGAINIDTGEALDSDVALNSGKIFNETVIARDSTSIIGGVTVPDAHEDFNITISYSSDNQNNMHLTSVESGGYDVIKSQVTSNSQEIQRRLPTSENGFSAGPLLYAVGLNATGLTSFTPTYHFDFPDEITTTGVVMPINNVSDDYADFGSYNPAQTGYTVIVTGADGSKITQRLRAGESYNPTTGLIDHFGSFSVGEKLAEGVKIAAYDITPDVPYFANARQGSRSDRSSGRNSINDITTGYINVLGYLNTKAQAGKDPSGNDYTYVSHISVESEYKKVQVTMAIQKIDELKLPFAMHNSPYSGGYGNNQATINTDETYIIGFRATASKPSVVNGINLDAGGILEGKPNNTATDRVGMAWPVEYKTIKDPIIYLTVPDQMDLTKYPGSNTFYMVSPSSRRVEVPDPKITQKTNAYGQTVMVLDWTGTGYEIEPGDAIDFAFKVRSDAVGSFDTDRTLHTQYAYEDKANGKTLDLYTADQLKAMGVSTEGLRAYAPNITSDNNTSWIQLGGDFSNSTISPNNKGKLKFDDGTTVDTLMIEAGNDRGYIRIITATEVKTATMIKGTADIGISSAGLNYPTKDFIEVNGNKVGLQTLQFGIVNNTSDELTGVISVMNLPQAGVADSNNPSAKQDFTLNISSAGVLTNETTNNYAKNAHTMYYSEQLLTLSSDGKTITFADGSTWTRGQAIPSQLKTADQVTDWSTIKSLMLYIPSLTEQDKIVYRFDTYSPTSEANMSKSVTLRQVSGYDDQLSVIIGTITDSYATYATLRIVDQDGNQINGYKDVQGKAILDETTGKYTVENADLIGKAGERLILEPAGAITGYKFVGNKYEPNELLLADGSTLIIRTYQVDTASLFEGSLAGTKLATATGDPQANTGSNFKEDPTGTNDIDFDITDAQLTRKGYSYTITVVDRNDKTLVDKDGHSRYDTLAQAVAAHKKFDSASDTAGSTQNFIVNYVGDFQKVVIISKDDPAKLLPTTITEAENKAPFYNDGVSGGVMFYDEKNTPIISDETTLDDGTSAFKRPNYRYTVIAPDGKEYNSLDEALAAKLTFDNTDNDGNTDKDIQIYEIKYVEDLQTLRVTVIDDQGTETRPVTLIDGQELGVGLSNSEITSSVKSEYENIIARYIAAGYVVVSQDVMPNNYDSDPNVDQMLVIHLRHATEEVAGASVTLTEKINYVYGGGVHKGEKVRDAYVSDPITFNAVDTIDKVTKKVINTVWSSAQILGEVQSPLVSGYTALPAKIESITVTHETPKEELEFTVQYVPDQQVINYQVIDDTDNKELVPVTVLGSGESESNVLLSTYQHYQAIVDEYEKQGYVIESMSEFPDKYDSDSTVDQLVVIHLSHGRLEEAGKTKTVKQTVSYVYGNGPKQGEEASKTIEKEYVFASRNTIDAVTREVLSTVWSGPQTTPEITSPIIDGYVADKQSIASQTLTHESADLVDVVTYTAGIQTVKIHYVDVYGVDKGTGYTPTSGTELVAQLQTLTGDAEKTYTNTLWNYGQLGYELVEAQPEAIQGVFDADPSVEQNYYVYLTHTINDVEGTPVTVIRTVNYVYASGPKTGQVAADSVSESKTFVPTYKVDQVTKQNVGEPTWSPESDVYSEVTSPMISGYTADIASVSAETITPTSQNSTITVRYTANEQVLTYTVIDDGDSGKILEDKVTLATGETSSIVGAGVLQNYLDIINGYIGKGYVVVSQDSLPANFDDNDAVDQNVVIHLNHGRLEEDGETKTVKQTVSYVYGNGPKQGEEASKTIEKEYVFTSRNTLDAVTKEVLSTVWSGPQTTPEITSPIIDGYVADKQSITSQTLTHESADLVDVVTYTAGIQTVKIHYVDVYGVDKGTGYTPTSGVELTDQLQTLTGDAEKAYTNTLWNFEQLGYELVEAQPEAIQGVFDADPSVEQNYYVYLTHTINDVEGTPVTVTRVVNYIYASGPKTGQVAADSVSEVKTFVPTYKVDQVTKQNVGAPTWTPASDILAEVTSPMISGYTADITAVPTEVVTSASKDSTVTVRYNANEQVLTYTVIDDGDNGKLLEDQVALATGETSSVISATVLLNYQNIISGYIDKGYVVVSQDSLPANFDDNDAVDQNVVIHLNHGRLEEAGETKTVKQTISYVYGNGPKQGEEASKTIEKEYVFTSKNTLDAVTKEVLSTVWSDLQTTPEIISPTIDGYVADKQSITSQSLTHESENLVDVVTYTAGIQTVKIHYVDVYGVDKGTGYTPTSGTELVAQLQTLTGDAEKTYTNTLWNYGQLGYELVEAQPEATQGVFDADPSVEQNYYVYLTHTINDVEGTPVTVTRVVNYVYASGPKTGQVAADSVSESKTFVPTYKVDQVTKQNVGAPTWTPASDILAEVTSPMISGYTADIASVSAETITPTSQNSTITVRYTANEQVLTYTVIDDGDSGKLLENQVALATGETSSIVGASVLQDYQNIINGYISKGYVVVSQDSLPANFDDNDAVDQNVVIHLEHGEKPVGPNDPHIPNTPVNPKDPDGPKWPTSDQYSKKYTSTITYVDDKGNKLTEDVVQTSIWTRTLLIDTVTGAIKNPDEAWTADRAQYSSVDSPLIKGYYVDKVMVASKDSIQDNLYEQVTYRALGKIVPVDPDGNPIPNVPNPQYPNDPTDPSKVISEQPVPNIPDMTPEVPTITPKDPGEDTKVVYNYDIQTAVINYIDETTGKQIASDSVTGRNNAKIEYTTADKLNELTNKGYVLVSDDFNTDAVFDNDKSVDQVFNVILQHGRVEEAGETKTIKQTINYVFGDGPKKGTPVAEMYQKEYVFTSRNTLDAVTREVLATVWSQSQSTKEVVSPKIKGYVADKALISKSDIEHTSSDLNDTVSYYAGKQIVTIHYIDVNGVKESETGYTPSDGKEIIDFTQRLSGEAGISYSNKLQDYVAKGYELVYAQPEAIEGVFDEDEADKQDYYVYLAHGTNKITGSPVIITDTVNYVYGNGPHKGENVFPPSVIEKMFIPTYVVDKVTGDILETTWTGDGTIEQSLVPVLEGYTADKTVIATRTLTPDMENQAQTVYYYVVETLPKEEQPSIPITTEVETKAPEVSQDVQEKPKQVTTISQKQMPAHAQEQVPEQEQKFADELPQTGDQDDKESMLLGLGLLSGALLGVAELQKKKKKTDK